MKPKVLISYDGTAGSKDALSLGRLLCDALEAKPVIAHKGGPVAVRPDEVVFGNGLNRSPVKGLHMLVDQVKPIAVVVGSADHQTDDGIKGGGGKHFVCRADCPVVLPVPRTVRQIDRISAICVVLDQGRSSEMALAEASAIARRLNVSLRIVAVSRTPSRRTSKVLESAARSVPAGIFVDTDEILGDPGPALAEYSKGFDLMVIGSERQGRLARVLPGGITNYLMDHAYSHLLITPRKVSNCASAMSPAPAPRPVRLQRRPAQFGQPHPATRVRQLPAAMVGAGVRLGAPAQASTSVGA